MRSLLFWATVIAVSLAEISCIKKPAGQTEIRIDSVQIKDDLPSFFELQFENEKGNLEKWISQYYETERQDWQHEQSLSVAMQNANDKLKSFGVVVAVLMQEDSVRRLQEALDKKGIPYFILFDGSKKRYLFLLSSFDSAEEARDFKNKFIDENYSNQDLRMFWNDLMIDINGSFIKKIEKEKLLPH